MGGRSSKEKKEDPAILNTTVKNIIDSQKAFTKDDCTIGNCSKFTNNYNKDNIYRKKYKYNLIKKYEFFILIIIFFMLLTILYIFLTINKK